MCQRARRAARRQRRLDLRHRDRRLDGRARQPAPVTCNNDSSASVSWSAVDFPVEPNVPYYIEVSDFQNPRRAASPC
jgi:hypothetical protein